MVKGDEQDLVSTGNAMEMLSDVLAGVMYGFVFVFVLFTIKSCNAAKAADDIFTEKLPAGIRRFSLAMLVFVYVWTALNYWGALSQYELHQISGCGAAPAPRTPFGQGTIAFLLLIVFLLFIASVLRVAAGISKEHKYTV